VVDVERGNQRVEPRVRQLGQPIGLVGERAVIHARRGLLVTPEPPLLACLLVPAAKGGGGADALVERRGRDQAGGVDGEHGSMAFGRHAFRLPLRDKGGLIFQHHRRSIGGQAIHQSLFALFRPVDILHASEAALLAPDRDIPACAQDEAVQPVRGERVILAKPVVDEHRQPEFVSKHQRRVDHRIIARSQRLLQPAEHVAARVSDRSFVQPTHTGAVAPVRQGCGKRGDHCGPNSRARTTVAR